MVTSWSLERFRNWAEEIDTRGCVTEKMQRYLRSSSQAMYTGSLSHQEIFTFAPNVPDGKNKLWGHDDGVRSKDSPQVLYEWDCESYPCFAHRNEEFHRRSALCKVYRYICGEI